MFIWKFRSGSVANHTSALVSSNFDAKIHKCLYFLHKSLDIHLDYAIFAQIYLK